MFTWSYKPEKVEVNEAILFFHCFELVLMNLGIVIPLYSSFYSNKALDSLRKLCMKWNIF